MNEAMENKVLKGLVKRQAVELQKAGKEVLRLLKWKGRRHGLTNAEAAMALSWVLVLSKSLPKRSGKGGHGLHG